MAVAMKASLRLELRNDILVVMEQITQDLRGLAGSPSRRSAAHARELLDIRKGLVTELAGLGFDPPALEINGDFAA